MNKPRRCLVGLLLAVMVGTAGGLGPAAPGLATHQAGVRTCFYYESNREPWAVLPVNLFRQVNGEWRYLRSGNTNASGCIQFNRVAYPGIYAFTVFQQYRTGFFEVTQFLGETPAYRITYSATWSWGDWPVAGPVVLPG